MRRLVSVFSIVGILSIAWAAAGQDKDADSKNLDKLQGKWRLVSSQVADEKAAEDEVARRRVTVTGDLLIYEYATNKRSSGQERSTSTPTRSRLTGFLPNWR